MKKRVSPWITSGAFLGFLILPYALWNVGRMVFYGVSNLETFVGLLLFVFSCSYICAWMKEVSER